MSSAALVALVLQGLGAIYAAKVAFSLLSYAFKLFIKPGASLAKFKAAKDWAVVTGATDGIGKAYAMALAKRGLNVLIVSRTQDKLDVVRQEIVDKHPGVEVRTHRTDFTAFDDAAVASLSKVIAELQVGVLVNNVAVNVEMPTYFDEVELCKVRDIITCNTLGTALLTHAVLPQMKSRKRGVIINLSSLGGTLPSAMLQPYGATKSFVENFSEALAEETKRSARRVPVATRPCRTAARLDAPFAQHALSRPAARRAPQVWHHRAVQRALLCQDGDGEPLARLAHHPRAARLCVRVALEAWQWPDDLALLVARNHPLRARLRAARAARALRAQPAQEHPQAFDP